MTSPTVNMVDEVHARRGGAPVPPRPARPARGAGRRGGESTAPCPSRKREKPATAASAVRSGSRPPSLVARVSGADPLEARHHEQVAPAGRAARHGHGAGLAGAPRPPASGAPRGRPAARATEKSTPATSETTSASSEGPPVPEVEGGHGAGRLDGGAELPTPFRVEPGPLQRELEREPQPGDRRRPDEGQVVEGRGCGPGGYRRGGRPGSGCRPGPAASRGSGRGAGPSRPSRCRTARTAGGATARGSREISARSHRVSGQASPADGRGGAGRGEVLGAEAGLHAVVPDPGDAEGTGR